MKHKEKVHLKQDPFANLVHYVLHFARENTRIMLWGAIAIVAMVVIGTIYYYLNLGSISRENEALAKAMKIKGDATLSLQQKIDQLQTIKYGSHLSSIAGLYSAVLYTEEGDYANAQAALTKFKGSSLPIVNDQKRLLEVVLLSSKGQKGAAIAALSAMLTDAKMQIGKDYLLLQLAKIQKSDNQKPAAVASLKRMLGEFPNSFYASEARTILEELGETSNS